jgi:O-antigen ligase
MFISGSRSITEWLWLLNLPGAGGTLEEGSPTDRFVYICLIGAGLRVLSQRRVRLAELVRDNRWLAVFLIYCLLAVLWSDSPVVALKRWIKVIGNPVMALIILTDPNPQRALTTVFKRCAFILLPVSVTFIKYFPEWGRGFSAWTGAGFNTGITTNKNLLGCDCLILGFFWFWHFLKTRQLPAGKARRDELLLALGFLAMTWWLLSRAESQTAFTALVIGIFMLLFAGSSWVNRRMVGVYVFFGVSTLIALEMMFGIYASILHALGRDATLTDRTLLWRDLLEVDVNPLLGAGFESFWLAPRANGIWEKWTFRPNQAHNGYLETYLNLGLIGLVLLICVLAATYYKSSKMLVTNFEFGRFRLAFLAATIAYNWTEAAFKTTHFVFFVFYIIAIDYRRRVVPRITDTERQVPMAPREPELVGALGRSSA